MKLIQYGDTLCVSEVEELATANSQVFRTAVLAALPSQIKQIQIDLSATSFVDCSGVSALLAVRRAARQGSVSPTICVLNPAPQVRRLFQLTHTAQLFAVDLASPSSPGTGPATRSTAPTKSVNLL